MYIVLYCCCVTLFHICETQPRVVYIFSWKNHWKFFSKDSKVCKGTSRVSGTYLFFNLVMKTQKFDENLTKLDEFILNFVQIWKILQTPTPSSDNIYNWVKNLQNEISKTIKIFNSSYFSTKSTTWNVS